MNDKNLTQCLLFDNLFDKPIVLEFDQPTMSSDGGGVLLKAADKRLGLTERMADCIADKRQQSKVQHQVIELLQQRVFGIALGYSDCNDAARLAGDPLHKLLVGREPIAGEALGSQPTLSRFENEIGAKTLFRMGEALLDTVIQRQRQRLKRQKVRRITLDLDPTDDPTHGQQQLSFFNGHYDSWCYLPMIAFLTFNDEPEQYLAAAVLRPGNVTAHAGAIGILRRIIKRLRVAFPSARIEVRLDGGFASPAVFDYLEQHADLDYQVGMAKNSVLSKKAEELMQEVRQRAQHSGQTEVLFGECEYAAKSWKRSRRVIIKAEVLCVTGHLPKDNPRFVVTNRKQTPQWIYKKRYCGRGVIENRIKELHEGVEIDRTSCTKFWANQFRVLMSAAAYVLIQEVRSRAQHTDCERAQVTTLRQRLFKLGARVVESVRRIVIHLPESYPYLHTWRRIATALGATPG